MSPFFLLDYHKPREYSATDRKRGVGTHPHRGFETVTIAYQGAIAHHDSAGNGGVILPDESIVVCITGNGYKTTDVMAGRMADPVRLGRGFKEFEGWWESRQALA